MNRLQENELQKIRGGTNLLSLYIERMTYMFHYMKISYLIYKTFE